LSYLHRGSIVRRSLQDGEQGVKKPILFATLTSNRASIILTDRANPGADLVYLKAPISDAWGDVTRVT
jgi:hypothetical protein